MFGKKKSPYPDGRKYRLAFLSMMLMLAGFALSGINPVWESAYPEFISGVLGICLLYFGGNVSNKIVLKKGAGGILTGIASQEENTNGTNGDRRAQDPSNRD